MKCAGDWSDINLKREKRRKGGRGSVRKISKFVASLLAAGARLISRGSEISIAR